MDFDSVITPTGTTRVLISLDLPRNGAVGSIFPSLAFLNTIFQHNLLWPLATEYVYASDEFRVFDQNPCMLWQELKGKPPQLRVISSWKFNPVLLIERRDSGKAIVVSGTAASLDKSTDDPI